MDKPLIGITTGGRSEGYIKSRHYREFFSTPAPYIDAVQRAGGIPLLLPSALTEWEQLLPRLDGIVVTGGTDIDPVEYGGDSRHPHLHPADRERDRSELTLARRLIDEGRTPTLFICRGLQVLNVAAGGTLHEHIPDIRDADIHRDEAGLWAMQEVHVEPDSQIAAVMGKTALRTSSGHHQAVRNLGAGLRIVALAEDGIIEALEAPAHPWMIAVQWHPEVTAAHDKSQQALFDGLVAKAREHQREQVPG